MGVTTRRPGNFDEGIAQLRLAVQDTKPSPDATHPRAKLWRACSALLCDEFLAGMRLLYEANAIVTFLMNTIIPHIEERLRYDILHAEYEKALAKPDNIRQNTERFQAVLKAVAAAADISYKKSVDAEFACMRGAMSALHTDDTIIVGLQVLYVSSKTARSALDLVFKRLIDAYQNDTSIITTTEIPFEAMFLR